jgi:hypothetical protein
LVVDPVPSNVGGEIGPLPDAACSVIGYTYCRIVTLVGLKLTTRRQEMKQNSSKGENSRKTVYYAGAGLAIGAAKISSYILKPLMQPGKCERRWMGGNIDG